jgi:hypothetical protein
MCLRTAGGSCEVSEMLPTLPAIETGFGQSIGGPEWPGVFDRYRTIYQSVIRAIESAVRAGHGSLE